MYGFPCCVTVSINPHELMTPRLLTKERHLRSSISPSSVWRSLSFSEYHGLRSLADGAKGTPFSVSEGSAFLLALMAAEIAFCGCKFRLSRTCGCTGQAYLFQVFEEIDMTACCGQHSCLHGTSRDNFIEILFFPFRLPRFFRAACTIS